MQFLSKRNKLSEFQARLNSVSVDGLSINPIQAQYIVQYRNSLIGRHFKSIVQVIAFTLHGLVDDNIRDIWAAAGNMVSLLWYTEIEDMEAYCVSTINLIERNTLTISGSSA